MTITVGIDWAEHRHDAAIMSTGGSVEHRLRFAADAAGFTELVTAIAEHGGRPDETIIGIETDKNLLVTALKEAGFTVCALNPRAVARYRERFGQAGGKSDAKGAMVLADILRTDRHQHRPMPSLSHQNQSLRVLARQHQEALWALHDTLNRLRSVLLEFYPPGAAGVSETDPSRRVGRPGRSSNSNSGTPPHAIPSVRCAKAGGPPQRS